MPARRFTTPETGRIQPDGGPFRYTNPIIDADVPDPDVIGLAAGGYAMVASSFDRSPGLPLWHSTDLLDWKPVGFAGGVGAETIRDGGVWAPSIREHDGLLHIVWGDPDLGVFATSAAELAGPWSPPRLLLAAAGIIDPCPYWAADGSAHIVHGWAASRAGFANRIDAFPVDPALQRAAGASVTLIDGGLIPGCTVLEGPKVYERGGEVWIFAPAGGVETGWQYAFRAPSLHGIWRHRIVLEQGAAPVNGPHQGAWVRGAGGEEWFLHFQATPHRGRVLHLQPLRWADDGWPLLGESVRGGPPEPVAEWATPGGGQAAAPPYRPPALDEELRGWHGLGAHPAALVAGRSPGALTLHAPASSPDGGWHGAALLAFPLDGRIGSFEVDCGPAAEGAGGPCAAALVLAGAERLVLEAGAGGIRLLVVDAEGERLAWSRSEASTARRLGVRLGVRFAGETAQFTVDGAPVGPAQPLRPGRWTGVDVGLGARASGREAGAVRFSNAVAAVRAPAARQAEAPRIA